MSSKSNLKKFGKTKGMANAVDQFVGRRLKELRVSGNFSQVELASSLGITFQQVQKYEAGTNRVSASSLYALSKIFDVNVTYFFEGYNDPTSSTAIVDQAVFENTASLQNVLSSKETHDLLRVYYSIKDPKLRINFLKLIGSLAQELKS